MIKRLFRYELRILASRKLLLIVGFLLLAALFALGALAPLFSDVIAVETRPAGVERADVLIQYQQMLDGYGGQNVKEAAVLSYFIRAGIDQYDCLPLKEIALRHDGIESIASAYSFMEIGSFVAVPFGILAGLMLFSVPRRNGYFAMEASVTDRKRLILGKLVVGGATFSLIGVLFLAVSLVISGNGLGQLFLFEYRNSFLAMAVWAILLMKAVAFILCSCFFFLVTILLDFLPRVYIGPMVLGILFLGFFLLSNEVAPKWCYYGEPTGSTYSRLFLLPLSNLIVGSNFGFIPETAFIFVIYLTLLAGGGALSVRYLSRIDL